MIIRAHASGRSFKWLAEYLGHDVKTQTTDRVAWTHTLNCAHDDLASAVHEMLHIYLDRDLLRAQAGVRPGGASIEKPVKHHSLSWDPSERPTREEMVAAAKSYLETQGWAGHQCVIFAHSDKRHQHVHLMINMVDPDRGTRLKDHREWRKAQTWAEDYERSRGKIFCTERLKPVRERKASPPRNVWQQLRAIDEVAPNPAPSKQPAPDIEYSAPAKEWQKQEWQALKLQQKADRIAFFENGRTVYRTLRQEIYRDVRAIYRKEWASYYRAMKHGAGKEHLATVKEGLLARQAVTLCEKSREAARSLRAERDTYYQDLLQRQKDVRAELTGRQSSGLTSPQLLSQKASVLAPGEERATQPRAQAFDRGVMWTPRAAFVPQQRSARRWLEYAKGKAARRATKSNLSPTKAMTQDRSSQSASGRKRQRLGKSIEPGGGPEL